MAGVFQTVGIAGVGLIGGSLARDIRRLGLAKRVLGWNRTAAHATRAVELGILDEVVPTLEALLQACDLVVLAMPVDVLTQKLPELLALSHEGQILMDVGSTKSALVQAVEGHPQRARFVACHPMAGTERSGPDAAVEELFKGRFTLIVEPQASVPEAVEKVATLWTAVGSEVATFSAEEHDRMCAMLSHMPHVLAYALARTIKEAQRTSGLEARFAGGGLASMTRIAHSPIAMWQPIFRQNKAHLLAAIDAFSAQLSAFREAIAAEDGERLQKLMR